MATCSIGRVAILALVLQSGIDRIPFYELGVSNSCMTSKSDRFRVLVKSRGTKGSWWLILSSRFRQYAEDCFNDQTGNRTSVVNHCRLYDGTQLINEWNPAWLNK